MEIEHIFSDFVDNPLSCESKFLTTKQSRDNVNFEIVVRPRWVTLPATEIDRITSCGG